MAHPDRSKRPPSTSVKRTGGPTGRDVKNFLSVLTGGKSRLIERAFSGGFSGSGGSGGGGGGSSNLTTTNKKKKIKKK
tara:strand:+ start:826 stop:1059 length:234 start_codon:yes stop_codon:yes gene_type:complete